LRHAKLQAESLAFLPSAADNCVEEETAMATKTEKKVKAAHTSAGKFAPKTKAAAPMGTSAVKAVRRKLGLTRKTFSRLTGYSERAIASWEAGGKPDEPGLRRIRETERFQSKLAEVVRPEEIARWLDAPNDAFDGLKPLEVIERGEIDRLWNMIYYLESGVGS
jgi:DNA-binding transcriptional regulator YiaG